VRLKSLILALPDCHLGDAVVAMKLHYVVVHRLWRQCRPFGIVLLQPVMHLGGGRVRIQRQTLYDELLVRLRCIRICVKRNNHED